MNIRAFAIFILLFANTASQGQIGARLWSIKDCVDTAVVNNLNVLQSFHSVSLSKLNLKQSKNNLLPTLNGAATEALNIGRTLNPVSYQFYTGTSWNTSFSLNTTLNLFSGLQNLNAIRQSAINYEASKYDLETVKYQLSLDVVNAYLQVLFSEEAVKIYTEQIITTQGQVDYIQKFVEAGKKTESDLLQLKAQLSSDKMNQVSAQNAVRSAKLTLQQLMNKEVTDSFEIQVPANFEVLQSTPGGTADIYKQALSFQPVVKAAQLRTQSAVYAVRVARGAYYPQLLFKGSFGTNYASASKQSNVSYQYNLENIGYVAGNPTQTVVGLVPQAVTTSSSYPANKQFKDNLNGTFSIGLSVPILNYLQVRNNVTRQKINLDNASLNEQITNVNLRKNVEQAYYDVLNALARYKAATAVLESVNAAYNLINSKYEAGKVTATDLLVQENARVKAESDFLQAKYELVFRQKILDYLKGTPLTF